MAATLNPSAIDLRSDTVTRPTEAMRQAMATAPVGDDVMGEDPTINELQRQAAALCGKEAALFVSSGTMANLLSLMTHCRPGDEVILGARCHIVQHEQGGVARVAGLMTAPLPDEDGRLPLRALQAAVREEDIHHPRSRLVCLESSHDASGGQPLPLDYLTEVRAWADGEGLRVHLDGARLFNAALALGCSPATIAAQVDSVGFCLSKGLGCPAGSVLCGSAEFVAQARRNRKLLGGGMRQVGILAAAGLYALEHHLPRLSEDHARAQRLASLLEGTPGLRLDQRGVPTNIVYLRPEHMSALDLERRAGAAGLLCFALGERIRLVLHQHISDEDVERAADILRRVVAS